LPDTTEVAKALVMYIQYLGGVIAKLPVSWPEPLRTISSRVSLFFGWITGSAASIDCLLALFGVEGAARAGLKGVINLLAPFATLLAMVILILVWWVVRRPVYALLAECASKELQGRWRRRAAVIWCCFGTASSADTDSANHLSLNHKWLQSKAVSHVPLVPYLCQRIVPVTLITAFFWYPSIVRIVLGMRACMKVCDTRYWVMDMSMLCPRDVPGKPQAVWATAVTVPAAIITGGLPLLVLVVMHHWRARMQDQQFLYWFGFLCSDYSYDRDSVQQATDAKKQPADVSNSTADNLDTSQAEQQSLAADVAAPPTSCIWSTCMWPISMAQRVAEWLTTNARPRVVAAWDVVIHVTTLLLTVSSVVCMACMSTTRCCC
jgi:hypothetical protein